MDRVRKRAQVNFLESGDFVLEDFSCREGSRVFRGDVDDGTRAGVTTGAGLALLALEGAEAGDDDLLATGQGVADDVEGGVHCALGSLVGKTSCVRNRFDEIRLVHDHTPQLLERLRLTHEPRPW